jgi:hypothetical protein
MLQRQDVERIRKAIEKNLLNAIETERGECIAVDDETNEEWGFKWREGEARIYVEPDDDTEDPDLDYVFAVQVVLVAVEPS